MCCVVFTLTVLLTVCCREIGCYVEDWLASYMYSIIDDVSTVFWLSESFPYSYSLIFQVSNIRVSN